MWLESLFIAAIILCGLKALRVRRLLTAVLWLAVTSALIATVLYLVGAPQVAAIELSVGAGLVTVMFVFSIAIAGEDAMEARTMVPSAVAWILIAGAAILLAWPILPIEQVDSVATEVPFSIMLWEERGLDVLVQIGLIFAGVMGILGLLAEPAIATEPKKQMAVESPVGAPTLAPKGRLVTAAPSAETVLEETP